MQFAGDLLHLWGAAAGPWAVLRAGPANDTAVLRLSCLCHLGQAVTVCSEGCVTCQALGHLYDFAPRLCVFVVTCTASNVRVICVLENYEIAKHFVSFEFSHTIRV